MHILVSDGLNNKVFFPILPSQHPQDKGVGASYTWEEWTCSAILGVRAGWVYNWLHTPHTLINCPVEFVPMFSTPERAYQYAGSPKVPDSEWILGFNECDLVSHGNCTPLEAAVAWRYIESVYPDRKLIAPVPSHLHVDWIEEMHNGYIALYGQEPRFDALAAHCYWNFNTCQALVYEPIVGMAYQWGVPEVWVTEFAYPVEMPADLLFALEVMDQSIAYFRWHPVITRFAWFQLSFTGKEWWAVPGTQLYDYWTHLMTTLGVNYRGY